MSLVVFQPVIHPVSEITAQYFISQSLGVDPAVAFNATDFTDWVLYSTLLPQEPDNCISINDTAPEPGLINMTALYKCQRYGLQIRTRAACSTESWKKAQKLKIATDQMVNLAYVYTDDIGNTFNYKFHGVETVSGPTVVGKEISDTGQGQRYLVSHNVLVSITPND